VAQTSANEQSVTSVVNNFDGTLLADNSAVGYTTTFTITSDIQIEHLALTLNFETTYVGDLRIVLTSADGTEVIVKNGNELISRAFDGSWVFGIDSLRGELSAGTWTVKFTDAAALDPVTVNSASMQIYGSTASEDDVYHFTDEYADMTGFEVYFLDFCDSF
jgi:subtilisin-like proprotein convertase family protein